jgi:putative Flp pilus-assembly TadE/G-like protein
MHTARAQRTGSERGHALIVALGAVFVVTLGAGVLAALGRALAQKGRLQRATDLAAVSAARSMRDDFPRLFKPPGMEQTIPLGATRSSNVRGRIRSEVRARTRHTEPMP